MQVLAHWDFLGKNPEYFAGVVFAIDQLLATFSPGIVASGLLDESAHVITARLVIGPRLAFLDSSFAAGVLIGSVLIDVDHVPLLLLKLPMDSAEDRPVSHSLLVPILVGAISTTTRGRVQSALLGVATGTLCHFMRDLSCGGIPAYWPFTRRLIAVPYAVYAVSILGLATRMMIANRRSPNLPSGERSLNACRALTDQGVSAKGSIVLAGLEDATQCTH